MMAENNPIVETLRAMRFSMAAPRADQFGELKPGESALMLEGDHMELHHWPQECSRPIVVQISKQSAYGLGMTLLSGARELYLGSHA